MYRDPLSWNIMNMVTAATPTQPGLIPRLSRESLGMRLTSTSYDVVAYIIKSLQ